MTRSSCSGKILKWLKQYRFFFSNLFFVYSTQQHQMNSVAVQCTPTFAQRFKFNYADQNKNWKKKRLQNEQAITIYFITFVYKYLDNTRNRYYVGDLTSALNVCKKKRRNTFFFVKMVYKHILCLLIISDDIIATSNDSVLFVIGFNEHRL